MRLMISCMLGMLVACGDKDDADTAVEVEDSAAEAEDTAEEPAEEPEEEPEEGGEGEE